MFGAIPSLHVAYPLLILLEGWKRHRVLGRALASLFFGSMVFSAVYLDHHWVTDVVFGVLYTTVIFVSVRFAWAKSTGQHPGALWVQQPLSRPLATRNAGPRSSATQAEAHGS
ncbi:MAG: phosphatase PAP2 family protein [Polyangiaceae bacterium]